MIYWARDPFTTKEEREKHAVNYISEIPPEANVHTIPLNWIIIEFDAKDGFDKKECEEAVFQTKMALQKDGVHVTQRTHHGFSDYLVVETQGLEKFKPAERKSYIIAFYDKYIPTKYRQYADEGFAGGMKWITILGKPHWKKLTRFEGKSWDDYTEEKIVDEIFPKGVNKLDKTLIRKEKKANTIVRNMTISLVAQQYGYNVPDDLTRPFKDLH